MTTPHARPLPSWLARCGERLHAAVCRPAPDNRLCRAIARNDLALVEKLLQVGEHGVNTPLPPRPSNAPRPQQGFTLLHEAARQGSFEMVELLLAMGASPTAKTSWNITPMHLAAIAAKPHVVALLAAHGASVHDLFPCLSHYAEDDPYTPTSLQLLSTAGITDYQGDEHARYRAERDARGIGQATPQACASPGRPRL